MIINRTNLTNLNTGFKTTFNGAFAGVKTTYPRITTIVPSSTLIETYSWMVNTSGMREWIGDRHKKSLETEAYTLKNKKYEETVEVPRDAIEDDQYGIFSPRMAMMGENAANNPEKLIYGNALPGGFITNCYDGQFFFDQEHPVRISEANEELVSNHQGGAGTAWYLLCTTRPMKPFIYQDRTKAELIIHDDPRTSDSVFNRDTFEYGTRARGAAGHGFWQLAYASKQELNRANFEEMYFKMMEFKADGGDPLGVVPDLLVVPASLATNAREVLEVERLANGASNPNYKLVETMVAPRLV